VVDLVCKINPNRQVKYQHILGISFEFVRLAHAKKAKILIADLQLGEEARQLVESQKNVHFETCDVRRWKDLRGPIDISVRIWNDVPDVYIAGAGVFEPVCRPL
jgi:hypothetical protein